MKRFITFVAVIFSLSAFAGNRFDQMETYREIQRLMKVQGKKRPALNLAKGLLAQLDQEDELYKEVSELIGFLGDGNPNFPLEKAIKYATGTKEEIYCKGVGLVHLEGKHNDGTKSSLKLISSNRDLGDTYSFVKGGDWVYELDTGYREPVTSESWLDQSTANSYQVREFRRRTEGNDKGTWKASWQGNSSSTSYSTSGETLEPLPMYMANDYHLWGAYDLGFKINFKVGEKDKIYNREGGSTKAIILKTDREVTKHLDQFNYKDAKGNNHKFSDCFKVHLKIELDKLEDYKR
ncbi:MAG: hypothetical protein KDD50_08130 [Bdellovibrionales bacterium]|nr:hypothetical protein [Bdellovibrionales bacterium]